jgi:hypothetical protein
LVKSSQVHSPCWWMRLEGRYGSEEPGVLPGDITCREPAGRDSCLASMRNGALAWAGRVPGRGPAVGH